jgi:hypothetical protein
MSRRVSPPSGQPAPATATLRGRSVELRPLAHAVAERYFQEFPQDVERYGDAARDWEVHDTSYCLLWAILDLERSTSLQRQIDWLARVLDARGFPLPQLARNLELAAEVAEDQLADAGPSIADRLRSAAAAVRKR